MSVQDDKVAGQEHDQQTTDKPEPDEQDKQRAAEMAKAYDDRPTVVLPGSGGTVAGTAVNDWLDEDGNPKYNNEVPDSIGSADKAKKDQFENDKALNVELRKAAAAEHEGEKR